MTGLVAADPRAAAVIHFYLDCRIQWPLGDRPLPIECVAEATLFRSTNTKRIGSPIGFQSVLIRSIVVQISRRVVVGPYGTLSSR